MIISKSGEHSMLCFRCGAPEILQSQDNWWTRDQTETASVVRAGGGLLPGWWLMTGHWWGCGGRGYPKLDAGKVRAQLAPWEHLSLNLQVNSRHERVCSFLYLLLPLLLSLNPFFFVCFLSLYEIHLPASCVLEWDHGQDLVAPGESYSVLVITA